VKVLRGLAGVAAGFAVFLAAMRSLSWIEVGPGGPAPGNYLLAGVTITIAGALLGGYLTALIAGEHEFPYSATVGLLIVGFAFISVRQNVDSRPGWYQIALAGCGPISAMIGAGIRLLTKRKQTHPQ
jgi:hypothetical protein